MAVHIKLPIAGFKLFIKSCFEMLSPIHAHKNGNNKIHINHQKIPIIVQIIHHRTQYLDPQNFLVA